ncbi:MAG: peptide-methionine (R)-S-oxide reductase [Bacteroidota bacterium]
MDEEWKKILSDEQFYILRRQGTEYAFSRAYWDNKTREFIILQLLANPCSVLNISIRSGTGWPIFYEPIDGNAVKEIVDGSHDMVRTEVVDSGSISHLGHVFNDGSAPTGLRYFMDAASLLVVADGEELPPIVKEWMDKHGN